MIITRHQMLSALDFHNTYPALMLPSLPAPFGVFLMTQYFKAIPKELDEAALLDGASRLKCSGACCCRSRCRRRRRSASSPSCTSGTIMVAVDLGYRQRHVHDHRRCRGHAAEFRPDQRARVSHGAGGVRVAAILIVCVFFQKYIVRAVSGAAVR